MLPFCSQRLLPPLRRQTTCRAAPAAAAAACAADGKRNSVSECVPGAARRNRGDGRQRRPRVRSRRQRRPNQHLSFPWLLTPRTPAIGFPARRTASSRCTGTFTRPTKAPNSLIDDFETKASEVATLYLGYQLRPNTRYNTDLIVDFENAGGRGISQALGLAGETNLDVVRNPTLSTAPYLARGEIHQIIGLTDEMTDQDRGPFALATKVPVRRFEIRIGKMSLPDTFDVNSVGSDSHLQFTNWTIDNNGAWDYAADTRGYTVGGILEYDDNIWSARYGIAAMPTVANGIDLDWAFSRANGQNWEFELRKGLFAPLAECKARGRGARAELM